MAAVLRASRLGEWWEHKLAPVLGTGYATAFMAGATLIDAAGALLLTLLALVPGAVYVSVLNDLTDREADRLAGKPNRLAGRPTAPAVVALAIAVVAGAAIAVAAWGDDPATLVVYAGAWIAFALYSIPPVRLKARGAVGAIADAAGAHLFPHLFVVAVVLEDAGRPFSGAWPWIVGAWALAHGLRGAMWHQLGDVEADRRSGLRTFAGADPDRARRLGTYVLFPAELVAFVVLLIAAGGAVVAALLPLYAVLEVRRMRRWGGTVVIAQPAPGPSYRIAMNEFYVAVYPLAFLVAATVRHPRDAVVLVVHLVVFPLTTARIVADVYNEFRYPLPAAAPR